MSDNNTSERKPLILIAEDVESNYKLLEIILKKEYDLLWAKNGKEAVEYAFAEHPDAVLMDIKMPVMDGIEALKEIRLRTTELPVIMQTAYAFDTDRRLRRGGRMQRIHHQARHAARTENVSRQIPQIAASAALFPEKTGRRFVRSAFFIHIVPARTNAGKRRTLPRKQIPNEYIWNRYHPKPVCF